MTPEIVQENKKAFIKAARGYIKRDGLEDLLKWLEDSDFYTAPASTRFHGSEEGGLCAHSLAVAQNMMKVADVYNKDIETGLPIYTKEQLTLVSLFHDLCKIRCYKVEMKNTKDENGQWIKVPRFVWSEEECYGGHGDKSVYFVMSFIKLSFDEAAAINTHMGRDGSANPTAVSDCYNQNLLAWMLHVADEAATYYNKM